MILKTLRLPRRRSDMRDDGFSLIELTIVILLLGLIVTVGLPNLQDWLETYRVRTAAQGIASDLQLQRMRAVSRNTRFTLAFDQAAGTFTLWQGDPVSGYTEQISPAPVVLPLGVTFTDPVDDPIELVWQGFDDVAVFHPDGSVNNRLAQDDTITLTNSVGTSFRIVMNQMTGRVQVLDGAS